MADEDHEPEPEQLRPAGGPRAMRRAEAIVALIALAIVASILLDAQGW